MSYDLTIPSGKWNKVREHLLSDSSEHLAFFLAKLAGRRLLVRDAIIVPDDDLEEGAKWMGISLKLPALLEVMNVANQRGLVLVEAHSHPFSNGNVEFSEIDRDGQSDLVSYLRDVSPDKAYAALVLGQNAVQGNIWLPDTSDPIPLDEVRVVGPIIERWNGNGRENKQNPSCIPEADNHHRQILALGAVGQRDLRRSTVAVVGLGGIGSMVAQELAHLGVGGIVLIDDDVAELTNLSRLVGALVEDVGKLKVQIAASLIESINPDADVSVIAHNVRDSRSISALQTADVIFGCVDTDAGRMILNEFALAYLIPYIDCGVGISADEGRISEAGGRIVVWVPGRPCLLCCGEFRPAIAAEELESPAQREFRQKHGYVSGPNVAEPSVISLNGTVASLAVTECLALVTGFRESGHYTYYDMLEQRVGPRIVKQNATCVACRLEGTGDSANLARYTRTGIPSDIPGI